MSHIILKTKKQILALREAGKIVAEVLEKLKDEVKPGVSTLELDTIAYKIITSYGAKPSFLNYGEPPFPGSICASVNDVVVHGIPNKKIILQEGDIISIDCGAYLNGWHGDAARTFTVGQVTDDVARLVQETENSFWKGFEQFQKGKRLGDMQFAVESHAKKFAYGIVRDFTGHGVGQNLHEDPSIPNYGKPGHGPRFQEGMVLALEPMLNLGTEDVYIAEDEWSVCTADGLPSAHYENTIALTENGPIVLTSLD